MSIRVPTRTLCRIAGAKHGRFNYLIASGLFPWVAPADKNHTRMWNADSILTVRIFRELIDKKINLHRAVKIANAVGAEASANPKCWLVAYAEYAAEAPSTIPLASLMDPALFKADENFQQLHDLQRRPASQDHRTGIVLATELRGRMNNPSEDVALTRVTHSPLTASLGHLLEPASGHHGPSTQRAPSQASKDQPPAAHAAQL